MDEVILAHSSIPWWGIALMAPLIAIDKVCDLFRSKPQCEKCGVKDGEKGQLVSWVARFSATLCMDCVPPWPELGEPGEGHRL